MSMREGVLITSSATVRGLPISLHPLLELPHAQITNQGVFYRSRDEFDVSASITRPDTSETPTYEP